MLIKRVKIKNFRQYYGEVELDFSTDPEKNVTVIRGENGVGKTAILNAIKWAFFETFTNNFLNKKLLVNNVALSEGKKSCSVEVEFEEDDKQYLLIRNYNQKDHKSKLALYPFSGDTLGSALPDPTIVINTLLPREMAEYFFFQGEGSNAVNVGNNGSNLAKSIRDILGFEVANKLITDLNSLSKSLRTKITELDTSGKAKDIRIRLEEVEKELDTAIENKESKKATLPEQNKAYNVVEEKLDQISNVNLTQLKQKERGLEQDLNSLKQRLKEANRKKFLNISQFGWSVFGADFATISQSFIDESELKGRLPEPYNETFIKDILNDKVCICGNDLIANKGAFERIAAMLNKAANPELMQRLSGIRSQIQDIKTLYDLAPSTIKENLENINVLYESIERKQKELTEVEEQINLIPEKEIKSLQQQKVTLRSDIAKLNTSIGKLEEKIETLSIQKEQLTRQLKEAIPDSTALNRVELKKTFVDELIAVVNDHLHKTESNIRLHVLTEVNKSLDKFSRHDFKIMVEDKSFAFKLLDKENNIVSQGDGLNLLLNLTITSSLINFAAQRRNVKDPILSSATVAPLLIDAPFGVLDNKYRNVVVNELPKQTRQVIFLVSSSQWSAEMDKEIRNKIGKEYVLILEESSKQGEKEIDFLEIKGQKRAVSRYECDIDRTVVECVS